MKLDTPQKISQYARNIYPSMSPRQLAILCLMEDNSEEIVLEGRYAWLGYEQVSPRTVSSLEWSMVIKRDCTPGMGAKYYSLNSIGKELVKYHRSKE